MFINRTVFCWLLIVVHTASAAPAPVAKPNQAKLNAGCLYWEVDFSPLVAENIRNILILDISIVSTDGMHQYNFSIGVPSGYSAQLPALLSSVVDHSVANVDKGNVIFIGDLNNTTLQFQWVKGRPIGEVKVVVRGLITQASPIVRPPGTQPRR